MLGGIALLLWVAVPNAVLCVLALRDSPATALASLTVGTLLVAWILVQLASSVTSRSSTRSTSASGWS